MAKTIDEMVADKLIQSVVTLDPSVREATRRVMLARRADTDIVTAQERADGITVARLVAVGRDRAAAAAILKAPPKTHGATEGAVIVSAHA